MLHDLRCACVNDYLTVNLKQSLNIALIVKSQNKYSLFNGYFGESYFPVNKFLENMVLTH